MKLAINYDTASHTRRYELTIDGETLSVAVTEEVAATVGETEVRRLVTEYLLNQLRSKIDKALYDASEHDAAAYSGETWSDYVDASKSPTVLKSAAKGQDIVSSLINVFPALTERLACPLNYCYASSSLIKVWLLVQHLNDDHKWTRQQIADWLETQDVDIKVINET